MPHLLYPTLFKKNLQHGSVILIESHEIHVIQLILHFHAVGSDISLQGHVQVT
jgi:hypothetical protein